MLGTFQELVIELVNKRDQAPMLMGAYILRGKADSTQENSQICDLMS